MKREKVNNFNFVHLNVPESDVVSFQVWIKCGSVFESKKQEGLSHFIEHLVFKGNKKYKIGQIAQEIESYGGELNAFTGKEYTCYYCDVPKEYALESFQIMFDMVFSPSFLVKDIDDEREVILEEIRRYKDIPSSVLFEKYMKKHFQGHPYSKPILGSEKVIKNVSKNEIFEYYKNYYTPENTCLVVCGDISHEKSFKKIKQISSNFKNNKKTNNKKINIFNPSKKEFSYVENKMNIRESFFSLGFLTKNLTHKDTAALDVLAFIMGQGESSFLNEGLKLKKLLVNSIGSSNYSPYLGGTFNISFSCDLEKVKIEDIIFNVVKQFLKICNTKNLEKYINKAKNNLIVEKIYEKETVDSIGKKVGELITVTNNLNFEEKYLKQLINLDKNDIIRVLKKYFSKKNKITLSSVIPKNQKKLSKEILKKVLYKNLDLIKFIKEKKSKRKNIKKEIKEMVSKINYDFKNQKEKTEIVKYKGYSLILKKDKKTPLVSFRMFLKGGSLLESSNNQGISSLLSSCLFFGTKKLSTLKLNEKIEKKAAVLDASSGKNTFSIDLDVVNIYLKEFLDIISDVVKQPVIEERYFEIEKSIIINKINAYADNLFRYSSKLFSKLIFKNHPYGFSSIGEVDSIKNIKRKDLLNFFKEIILNKKMSFSFVGDFKEEDTKKWFKSMVDYLSSKNKLIKNKKNTQASSKKVETFIETKDKINQAHVFLGYLTCESKNKDTEKLDLVSSVLSGQSGRLFVNLRDKKSLAYSVSPLTLSGFGKGCFCVYIATENDKVEEAIKGIKKEIDILKTKLISSKELQKIKKRLIGKRKIDMQSFSSQSSCLALNYLYDSSLCKFFNYEDIVKKITSKEIKDVSKKYFNNEKILVLTARKNIKI
jgi:zinc protease